MEERFHGGLAPTALHGLSRRSNGPAAARAAVQIGLLVASAVVVVHGAPAAWWWGAFGIQVLMQFAMFGLLHEAVHGTAFASRGANGAARWVAAVWQFAPPTWMRAFHFAHHRHTHDLAADPELAGLAWMARWPHGPVWFVSVSGLQILVARIAITGLAATGIAAVFARAMPYVAPAQRAAVARDARILLLVHAVLVAASCTTVGGVVWLYAAALPAHALLATYLTCEHRGLPTGGDVLQRTRSLRAGPVLRYLLWNMPFHAEHHAYPSVPFHALPELHTLLEDQLPHRGRSVFELHFGA